MIERTTAQLLIGLAVALSVPGTAIAQTTPDPPEAAEPAPLRELSGTLQQSPAPDTPVQLGEPIPISITIVHPPGVDVVLPSSFASGRWELLDSTRKTVEGEKEWTTEVELKLGVFRPGETTLSPFPIELVSPDGEGVLMSEPISVKAVSSLDDPNSNFTDPRPPATVWIEDNTLLWVGGFGATALLFGLFFFAARRRREDIEPTAPPRPAHEVALEKLGRLAGDDMVERGEHMVFYVLLSEAIREYLGRRYGFKAVEMTTTEILVALEQAEVQWPEALSHDDVSRFLLHCDSVKFGGVIPSSEVASEKLRRAFHIVEATRPRGLPVVTEPSEAEPQDDVSSEPVEDPDARWRPPESSADDSEPVLASEATTTESEDLESSPDDTTTDDVETEELDGE